MFELDLFVYLLAFISHRYKDNDVFDEYFFLIFKMLFRLKNASLPTPGAMKLQIRQKKNSTPNIGALDTY